MMPLQPSPLLRGFEQGADGTDTWNDLVPGGARGPLTLDPQGVALGQQFQAIKAGIEAQQTRPIWDQNNPVGTETLQSMGMPQPTTYAGPVGQFIDPATGRMTEQGVARMENPMFGVDTGGLGMVKGVMPEMIRLFHGTSPEGLESIKSSGRINGPAFFTGRKGVAQDYAGGGPVVEVNVPKSKLKVDFDLPGGQLLKVKDANGYSGKEGWTIDDYIRNGHSVGIDGHVPTKDATFHEPE